jgi:hypothetical protein
MDLVSGEEPDTAPTVEFEMPRVTRGPGGAGPGSRLPFGVGTLAADPRMPIWIGRAVVAGAAGIAIGAWLDWRLGVTVAAVVAVADTIYRSRTTSVIPAHVRVASAQRRTRRRLFLLRLSGYASLSCRAIPGSDSVIDHLVIGPAGVFALDSERWDRRLPVRASSGGQLYHGPFSQQERLRHAMWEARQARAVIGAALGEDVPVRPAMAIYGPVVPWISVRLGGVDVFAGRRLRRYLWRQARGGRTERLSYAEIRDIYFAAARALPPAR